MQRVLEPGQIEAFAQRSIPRLRLPDRASLFSTRAERLRALAADSASGRAIGDYLRLMASVADAQQEALASVEPTLPSTAQIAQVLTQLCDAVTALPDLPASVRVVCDRLSRLQPEQIEREANGLLSRSGAIDVAAAPFLMAALQVYWVAVASRVNAADVASLDAPVVCPVCGSAPVASIVGTDPRSQGFRYLCCALCAAQWHMVRVTCSHCRGTKGIVYHSVEGGSPAIRAECCDSCRTYRKIFYQEHDAAVEPVADDLASLALDLLLSETGYHRASGNPLLWSQPTG